MLTEEEFEYWKARLIKDRLWDCDYFDKLNKEEQYKYVELERLAQYPNPDPNSIHYKAAYTKANSRHRDIYRKKTMVDTKDFQDTDKKDMEQLHIIDLIRQYKFGSEEDFRIFCIDNNIDPEEYRDFLY